MDPDPLVDLLKRADAAAPAPKLRPDLAVCVRRRIARNERWAVFSAMASVAAAAAVVVLAIRLTPPAASLLTAENQTVSSHLTETEVAELRSEIARLDREADALSAVVHRTNELQRARFSKAAQPFVTDARVEALRQFDTAACMAVMQATRLEATSEAFAATAYREVVTIFPNTTWAEQARRRLAALSGQVGGSS